MDNQELRGILIKELGLEGLPQEAQDEIVVRLGEIILKSVTIAIFEKLSAEARAEFERISAEGDAELIQKFLDENIPDMQELMAAEVKKTLQGFNLGEKNKETN